MLDMLIKRFYSIIHMTILKVLAILNVLEITSFCMAPNTAFFLPIAFVICKLFTL